jgi:transcriptional regulator with XRE-family HTH domain
LKESLQQKVGKRIQEIRIQKNISQQELAAKCNFEKSNMSRLENGNANATLTTLEKVCDALKIDYIELFKF